MSSPLRCQSLKQQSRQLRLSARRLSQSAGAATAGKGESKNRQTCTLTQRHPCFQLWHRKTVNSEQQQQFTQELCFFFSPLIWRAYNEFSSLTLGTSPDKISVFALLTDYSSCVQEMLKKIWEIHIYSPLFRELHEQMDMSMNITLTAAAN